MSFGVHILLTVLRC